MMFAIRRLTDFMATATPDKRKVRFMRLSSLYGKMCLAPLFLGVFTLLSPTARAQPPQPKVGGNGTFDSGAGNSEGANGRRRLSPLTAVPEDFSGLQLAPGFLLSMEVYDVPELSTDARIDTHGDVTLPMIGSIHVAGQTMTEAAAAIETRFKDGKFLNSPQVTLNISQYAGSNVSVLGEVRNPGRIELLASHSLEDVIALAGGETEVAGNTIEIRHPEGVTPQKEMIHYS